MEAKLAGARVSEIEQMPEVPQHRGPHHRRAHSDTSFRCFDDLLLFDPSDLDLSSLDLPPSNPPPPRASPMAVDSSDDSSSNGAPPHAPPPLPSALPKPPRSISHLRSLSVDSDFFDGFALTPSLPPADDHFPAKTSSAGGEKRPFHHRHSNSMDGTISASFELDSIPGMDGIKKAMAPDRLAELALIDPKRAKRILANRQSAARSKERKTRYTNELERKVQTLQTEATTLSAQVTMLQRDTTGLTAENKELKLRLQAMEQQAQLRDALNEALREEVQRLKIAAGQVPAVNGNPFNRVLPPQFSSQQTALHLFGNHPGQQQQQQQQTQIQTPQSSPSNQSLNGQLHPSFMDFN